ncbi:winged helix-turn-helix transcriptional regulator [Limosilactobacillus equigenerosi]|nr:helix-turn-helix domain-containing protein [Limosilactobacillus equigenerosi]
MEETGFCLCPHFAKTFEMLGKKWNGLIIEALLHQEQARFKDLASQIPACSDRVLCARLKELEDEGIVERVVKESNARPAYRLTPAGQDLAPVMDAVHVWSEKWR